MATGATSHSRRPRQPGSGRLLRRTTSALVIFVLVLAGLAYQFDLGRLLGWDHPSPITDPAGVAPPPGLSLPSPAPAPQVAQKAPALDADPAKLQQAVERLLTDRKLGPHVAVAVNQLFDGKPVYRHGADLVVPASTMKLVTTVAALETMGPDRRFRTSVRTGPTPRDIVLVGGGDPLLARAPADPDEVYPPRADLRTLAAATARSLKVAGRLSVRLAYDTSLFTGPRASPAWEPTYITDQVVSPITSLWVDEGREKTGLVPRSDDPAQVAAQEFAAALKQQQITVRGAPRPAKAPVDATEIAGVDSAPLAQIVQWVLEVSDNEAAEVLFRHVAVAEGRAASFDGASAAVTAVLARLGVDVRDERILDGSGLSRRNRLAPDTLLSVLELAADENRPALRPVAVDLPVAGFTGSLASRFGTGDESGLGRVRAKTGTLSGVHGLAGVVTDLDGTVLSFVAIADRVRIVDTLDARTTIDEVAAALAGCRCAETVRPQSASPQPPAPSDTPTA